MSCKFNHHIDCNPVKGECWRCGWNPEVEKERKKEYLDVNSKDIIIAELKRENRQLRKLIMQINKDPKVHPLAVCWID